VTIRTRTFAALWLLNVLAAAAMVLVMYLYLRASGVERDSLATMVFGVVTVAAIGVVVVTWLIVSAKRDVLDPLRSLADSAEHIRDGDFSAAHQTLRDDEIGVLFNSFAKMANAVQMRERELARR
jgi:nitrate/nitrite-specific signal transduction histidine kinase